MTLNLSYFFGGIGHSMATLIHSSIYREDLVPAALNFPYITVGSI